MRVQFNIPKAQPLGTALRALVSQASTNVMFDEAAVAGKTAPPIQMQGTLDQALGQLLKDTGLEWRFLNEATVVVGPAGTLPKIARTTANLPSPTSGGADTWDGVGSQGVIHLAQSETQSSSASAVEDGSKKDSSSSSDKNPKDVLQEIQVDIPEILVRGSRMLNMDIKRTEDDVQPYVVFDREAIERSQAVNLEDFFKTRLPMNTVQSTASQSLLGSNQSSINLRGLGTNQTLILVDGRHMPNVSNIANVGDFAQPDINGIPLSAIERIEVLPATASGIYGGGATGGVINIILRRDYTGLDVRASYANTFHSDVADRRLEVTGGFAFNGGKTSVTIRASYSDSTPLQVGERDFAIRGRELLLANDPAAAYDPSNPPLGYTSNIASADGSDLDLKNGPSLGSPITFVPVGYAGAASDDGAAFVANAGQYNLDPSNDLSGRLLSLLSNPTERALSVDLRHEFNDHVQGFLDLSSYGNLGASVFGAGVSSIFLSTDTDINPFVNDIFVAFPTPYLRMEQTFDSRTLRGLAGAIVRLPHNWMTAIEYGWSRSRTEIRGGVAANSNDFFLGLLTGEIDILRDLNASPPNYAAYGLPSSLKATNGPYDSVQQEGSLRLAGPIIDLRSGPVILAALVERLELEAKEIFDVRPDTTQFHPRRSQVVSSYSLESRVPLISAAQTRTGARELELQASFRADESVTRGVPLRQIFVPPMPQITATTNKVSSSSHTLGLRYVPVRDLAVRVSYSTGFLPPSVGQIAPTEELGAFVGSDPKRGNEFSVIFPIPVNFNGNPNLDSELSESWSAGLIFTPSFVPDLRLSVDHTTIRKTDEIAQPSYADLVLIEDTSPGRITRAPLTPEDEALGYVGGRITAVDLSQINVAHTLVRSYDIKADYTLQTSGAGTFIFNAIATWQPTFERQVLRSSPVIDSAGFNGGPLKWRGNVGVTWDHGPWLLGWNMQYYDSYLVYSQDFPDQETLITQQGSDRIPRQMYHDLIARYRFDDSSSFLGGFLANTYLMLGVQNVLDKSPPIVATIDPSGGYSTYGDPRLRRYSISVRKSFSNR